MMILVVDAVQGIQTQTAECIVIGQILMEDLIVVINKIDLLGPAGPAREKKCAFSSLLLIDDGPELVDSIYNTLSPPGLKR